MITVRFWRAIHTRSTTAEYTEPPVCTEVLTIGVRNGHCCGMRPAWVLAWTHNDSGLPGMGESRSALVCASHLRFRMEQIPYEYTGSVTVTPYKGI